MVVGAREGPGGDRTRSSPPAGDTRASPSGPAGHLPRRRGGGKACFPLRPCGPPPPSPRGRKEVLPPLGSACCPLWVRPAAVAGESNAVVPLPRGREGARGREAEQRCARAGESGSPGNRTPNLGIKSPLLYRVELATRRKVSQQRPRHNPARERCVVAQWQSSGLWRSLAAHLLWEQGVAGSNPASPTAAAMLPQPSAGVAQWQSSSLPSWRWGFDSPHPLGHRCRIAPVAQWTEQEPSKLLAGGSNPSGGTGGPAWWP